MRRGEAPIARRMPNSRCFCTNDTTSTLAMPSATISTRNTRTVRVVMVWFLNAVSSWVLIAIQLSAVRPVWETMRVATFSASKMSSTVRSR